MGTAESATPKTSDHGAGIRVLAPLLLLALCALLFGYALQRTSFRGLYDDVDRAYIGRTMADSGDWLSPVYHDNILYTKPPLMYWLVAALYGLTGRRDELPAALVSVLASLVVVLATYGVGSLLWDRRVGLVSGLLLATSYLFLSMARQPLLDTVMMGGFALSFWAVAHLGHARNERDSSARRRTTVWWLCVALGLALATLTKGPVVLPVLILISVPLWLRRPRILPNRRQVETGAALFVLLVAPWYLAVFIREPYAGVVWAKELTEHFTSAPPVYAWTRKPWWFYLADMGNFLPWLPLLPAAVVLAIRKRQERRYQLLLWWAIGGLVFFSLASVTKRSYYLLPLYPAFALLCGVLWNAAAGPSPPRLFRAGIWVVLALLLVMGAAAVLLPLRFAFGPELAFWVAGACAILLGIWSLLAARRGRWTRAFASVIATAMILELLYVGYVVPPLNDYISGKPFYMSAATRLGPGRLAVYHAHRSLTAFYLDRRNVPVWEERDIWRALRYGRGGFLVADPRYAEQFGKLEPLLVETLTSPFGQTKQLGLYGLPDWRKQSP